MTAILDTPIDEPPAEIPRDQWGRPKILQPNGKLKGYKRISGLAKELDTGFGLPPYYTGMAMIGMAHNPHLWDEMRDLVTDFIPHETLVSGKAWDRAKASETGAIVKGQPQLVSQKLRELGDLAQELAGANVKRDKGTTIHFWSEQVDAGLSLSEVPAQFRADVDAYMWATAEMEVLAAETFVVVDEVEAAGTLDRLMLDRGRVVVGDLKTGQSDCDYPMAVETQVAIYARGQRYDFASGERTPLHPEIDLDHGILIHCPSGKGRCEVYELDLARGWRNALLATEVKRARAAAGRKLKPRT